MKNRKVSLELPEVAVAVLERAATLSYSTLESFLEARLVELVHFVLDQEREQGLGVGYEEPEEDARGPQLIEGNGGLERAVPIGFHPAAA